MKIKLIVVGKTNAKYLHEGEKEYGNRLKHYTKFEEIIIPDVKQSGKWSENDLKKKEFQIYSDAIQFKAKNFVGHFLHGLKLKSYVFEKYKTKKNEIKTIINITFRVLAIITPCDILNPYP